jgi:molybdopterin-guanine dinucleotide biosynthesis protein A
VDSAAGVVLAGGRSSRMGRPKSALEWHGATLLHRTAAVVGRVVTGPVVVVRAPGQQLPELPAGVETVADPTEGLGPMQGVAAGLAAVRDRAGVAFVCSTDLPFLHPAYVRRVLQGLGDPAVDLVLPLVRGFRQPLAAGYRTALAGLIGQRLAAGDRSPSRLPEHCRALLPDEPALLADPALARADPDLDSVRNVNDADEYAQARARPGPAVVVDCAGAAPRTVAAASLGEAAAAVGLSLDRHEAAINGEPVAAAPWVPLVSGDTVAFRWVGDPGTGL